MGEQAAEAAKSALSLLGNITAQISREREDSNTYSWKSSSSSRGRGSYMYLRRHSPTTAREGIWGKDEDAAGEP